jgi:hypothetical protein
VSGWYDDYGEPENKRAAVERHLARMVKVENVEPDVYGPPTPNHCIFPDDFVRTPTGWPISKALATMIGYEVARPRYAAGDDGQGVGGDD